MGRDTGTGVKCYENLKSSTPAQRGDNFENFLRSD